MKEILIPALKKGYINKNFIWMIFAYFGVAFAD